MSLWSTATKRLKRPHVGFGAVLSPVLPRREGGGGLAAVFGAQGWKRQVLRHGAWVFIVAVALVVYSPFSNKHVLDLPLINRTLGAFALFVLGLEVASRYFPSTYDAVVFLVCRIAVNVVVVSTLVIADGSPATYFSLFFALPIIQCTVYFKNTGTAIGTVLISAAYWIATAMSARRNAISPDLIQLLIDTSVLVGVAYLGRWLFEAASQRRSLEYLRTLGRVSHNVFEALTLDEALQVTLVQGLEAINARDGSVMLLNPESKLLEIRAWMVNGAFQSTKTHRTFAVGEGIAGQVVADKKSINVRDVDGDPRYVQSFSNRSVRSLLVTPIMSMSGTQVLGTINADSTQLDFFRAEEAEFLSALADHLSVAIESAKLRTVGPALITVEVDALLKRIVEKATSVSQTDNATIFLVDRAAGKITHSVRYPKRPGSQGPRAEGGLTQEVIRTGRAIVVPNAQSDPRVRDDVKAQGVQSILGVPLVAAPNHPHAAFNEVIGVLFVNSKRPLPPPPREQALVEDLATHAALAIANAALLEAADEQTKQLLALHQVTHAIHLDPNLPKLLDTIAAKAVDLLKGDSAAIFLKDEASPSHLLIRGSYRLDQRTVDQTRIAIGTSIAGRVVETRTAKLVADVSTEPLFDNPLAIDEGIKSLVCVPLWVAGDVIGTLGVHSKTMHRAFNHAHLQLLSLMAVQAAAAIGNKQLIESRGEEVTALQELYHRSLALTELGSESQLVDALLEAAIELVAAPGGAFYRYDKQRVECRLTSVKGAPSVPLGRVVVRGKGVVGEAIESGRPYTLSQYRESTDRIPEYDAYGFTAVAAAPVVAHDVVVGALAVHTVTPGAVFGEKDLRILGLLGLFAGVALENLRRASAIKRLKENAIDGIIAVDEAGTVVECNSQAERILGFDPGEVLEKKVTELYAFGQAYEVQAALDAAKDHRISEHDTHVVTRTGEAIPIRLSAARFFDAEGQPDGSVGFFRDLRDLKSAEKEIAELKRLFAASSAISALADRKDVVRTIAQHALKTTGARTVYVCSCDETSGELVESGSIWLHDEGRELEVALVPAEQIRGLLTGDVRFEPAAGKRVGHVGSGTLDQTAWAFSPLRVRGKRVGAILWIYPPTATFNPLTQLVIQLFAELSAIALENVRQAEELELAAWQTIYGGWGTWIAHDMQRDAALIRAALFNAMSGNLPDGVLGKLKKIDGYIQAFDLPNEAGSTPVAKLRSSIQSEVDWARQRYPTVTWQTDLNSGETHVAVASFWLKRIIRQMLRNAGEALAEAPVKEVRLSVLTNERDAICSISDTGPGLAKTVELAAFRRLIRRPPARGGVGLLLVGSTLKDYDGEARVAWNRPGEGVCFELRLPLSSTSSSTLAHN